MADDKPVIIVKKKGGHGGHHGGAWKIAYADFVTAMMAFFMVMWLVNTADAPTKKNIASYFRRPGLFELGSGAPIDGGNVGILSDGFVPTRPEDSSGYFGKFTQPRDGRDKADGGDQEELKAARTEEGEGFVKGVKTSGVSEDKSINHIVEPKFGDQGERAGEGEKEGKDLESLEQAAQDIREQIMASAELQDLLGMVDIKIDSDGLNIEIMDTEKASMFRSGSAAMLPEAQAAFGKIAEMIKKLPNTIDIVGHTDARPYSKRKNGYSNWELSADRANTARRLLEAQGIESARITNVMGRADKELRVTEDPFSPNNRRITLKLRFLQRPKNPTLKGAAPPGTIQSMQAQAQRKEAEREKTHTFTVQEILEKRKKKEKDPVRLPNGPVPTQNPPHMPKDLIFGDSPVIGPKEQLFE